MNDLAAVTAFDGAAAQRACALLTPSPHQRARLLCFEDQELHDWRAHSADALSTQLEKTPIRSLAALAQGDNAPRKLNAQTELRSPRHVAAVVAGLITNLRPLRKHMVASGWVEQDADPVAVVARLMDFHLRKGKSPLEAVRMSVQKLQGAFTVAAITPDDPATIYVAAKGAEVLVGFNDGAACALSDAAMRPRGGEFAPLEADDVAILSPKRIVMTDLDGMQIVKQPRSATLVPVSPSTGLH